MARECPDIPFERYADDIVAHCRTEREAIELKAAVEERLRKCKLELHPEKTRIVYCKDQNRGGGYPYESFDFLGYTFRPRLAKNRRGQRFVSFQPGMSGKAEKRIHETVREWGIGRRTDRRLEELAREYNSVIRGWINYYGQYGKAAMRPVLQHLNGRLARWVQRKYKRKQRERQAIEWLRGIAKRQPELFAHWAFGVKP
jgi:hypothetical protein